MIRLGTGQRAPELFLHATTYTELYTTSPAAPKCSHKFTCTPKRPNAGDIGKGKSPNSGRLLFADSDSQEFEPGVG